MEMALRLFFVLLERKPAEQLVVMLARSLW